MKILIEKSYNGASIHGDAVMLSKYGEVYNAIDNLYHPNPGPRDEGYPEIERCIDWCYQNDLKAIRKYLDEWIIIKVAQEFEYTDSLEELINEIMYADLYVPCKAVREEIATAYNYFTENPDKIEEYRNKEDILVADKIVEYINEKFTRVRAGGKLNPEGTNSIYFRISSHGFDWHRVFTDFLWDTFESPDKMPRRIVICHDAENNPPEKILFDGTPGELLEKEDATMFEDIQRNYTFNRDRDAERQNKLYYNKVKQLKEYVSYK